MWRIQYIEEMLKILTKNTNQAIECDLIWFFLTINWVSEKLIFIVQGVFKVESLIWTGGRKIIKIQKIKIFITDLIFFCILFTTIFLLLILGMAIFFYIVWFWVRAVAWGGLSRAKSCDNGGTALFFFCMWGYFFLIYTLNRSNNAM